MTWREILEWSAHDEQDALEALMRKSKQMNDAALKDALANKRR